MAKYNEKMYAKVLVDLLLQKNSPAAIKTITENFVRFLVKNGDIKKSDRILFLAESLLYKKTGKRKVLVELARISEKKNILKSFIKNGDVVETRINPDLVAGMKVTVNGVGQLDFSFKKALEQIL